MTTNAITQRPGQLTSAADLDYFLVDGSGSMQDKWWDLLAAMDTYLDSIKTFHVDSHVITHVFDDNDLEMIQRDCPLRDCKTFRENPIGSHFGGTPLYDAINLMGRHLKERNPKRCSILVVTDGGDTGGSTNIHQASAILNWCRAKGWQVTFIGCDFNNSRQAKALGISDANSIGVQKKLLSSAAKNFAAKRAAYHRDGTEITFTDAEKQQFGGYLTDQSNGK